MARLRESSHNRQNSEIFLRPKLGGNLVWPWSIKDSGKASEAPLSSLGGARTRLCGSQHQDASIRRDGTQRHAQLPLDYIYCASRWDPYHGWGLRRERVRQGLVFPSPAMRAFVE